jgi:hypothetical protein
MTFEILAASFDNFASLVLGLEINPLRCKIGAEATLKAEDAGRI